MFGWGSGKERREAPRYYISDTALAVEVERNDSGTVLGQLVDISQSGAKFCLDTSLQFSETVVMHLAMPALDISAAIKSKIVWTRTTDSGGWLVGCSFDEILPNAILSRLGQAGVIDRRRHPRLPTELAGIARWELGNQSTTAVVLDYSKGGFCIASDTPATPGSKVMVQFEPDKSVFGVVRWCSLKDDRCLLGCEFRQHSEVGKGAEIIRELSQLQTIQA